MILSAKEAPAYFNNHISYYKLLEMYKCGKIPEFTIGSRIFFNTETLDKWIASLEQGRQLESEVQYGKLRRIDGC